MLQLLAIEAIVYRARVVGSKDNRQEAQRVISLTAHS